MNTSKKRPLFEPAKKTIDNEDVFDTSFTQPIKRKKPNPSPKKETDLDLDVSLFDMGIIPSPEACLPSLPKEISKEFVFHTVESTLKCTCGNLMDNPVNAKCGHVIDRMCMIKADGGYALCPVCNKTAKLKVDNMPIIHPLQNLRRILFSHKPSYHEIIIPKNPVQNFASVLEAMKTASGITNHSDYMSKLTTEIARCSKSKNEKLVHCRCTPPLVCVRKQSKDGKIYYGCPRWSPKSTIHCNKFEQVGTMFIK